MELSARQLAAKAIHGDKENVSNPSIMAKYMREHTNSKLNKILRKLEDKREHLINPCCAVIISQAMEIIKKEITKNN